MAERRRPTDLIMSGEIFQDAKPPELHPDRWIDRSTLIEVARALNKTNKNSPNGARQLD